MADTISPSSIASEEAFGSLQVNTIQTSGIASGESFGTPGLTITFGDSLPKHPIITFQINLQTLNRMGFLHPYNTQLIGNQTVTEASDQINRRSTWLPGLLGGENVVLKNGNQFTVKGLKALYLKNLYVTGSVDDLLKII